MCLRGRKYRVVWPVVECVLFQIEREIIVDITSKVIDSLVVYSNPSDQTIDTISSQERFMATKICFG